MVNELAEEPEKDSPNHDTIKGLDETGKDEISQKVASPVVPSESPSGGKIEAHECLNCKSEGTILWGCFGSFLCISCYNNVMGDDEEMPVPERYKEEEDADA